MRKKPPLTKARSKWIENRRVALHGTRLAYNAAQQARYENALRILVRKMTDDTKRQLVKLFEGTVADDYFEHQQEAAAMDTSITSKAKQLLNKLTSKFDQLFSLTARPLAKKMVEGASKASEKNLHASLKQLSGGLSLKTGVVPEGMEDVANATIA